MIAIHSLQSEYSENGLSVLWRNELNIYFRNNSYYLFFFGNQEESVLTHQNNSTLSTKLGIPLFSTFFFSEVNRENHFCSLISKNNYLNQSPRLSFTLHYWRNLHAHSCLVLSTASQKSQPGEHFGREIRSSDPQRIYHTGE